MLLKVNNREYNKAKANGFKGSYAQFAEGCNKVNSELLNSNQVVSARKYFNDLGQTTITDINNLLINDLKQIGVLKDEEVELPVIKIEDPKQEKKFPVEIAIGTILIIALAAWWWLKKKK